MKKIMITQEQKGSFDYYMQDFRDSAEESFNRFIEHKHMWGHEYKPLNDFTPQQFALLLCGWYEVEQPFQVGDWCIWEKAERGITRKYPFKLQSYSPRTEGEAYFPDKWPKPVCGGNAILANELRRATPEEIAQEKKRRFWSELGREVDGYIKGDIVGFKFDGKFIYRKVELVNVGGGVKFIHVDINENHTYRLRPSLIKELIPHDVIVNVKDDVSHLERRMDT